MSQTLNPDDVVGTDPDLSSGPVPASAPAALAPATEALAVGALRRSPP